MWQTRRLTQFCNFCKSKFRFELLSKLVKILVIPASSAESEGHFSSAGKITRKNRARLHGDMVETSVLVAQALKIS